MFRYQSTWSTSRSNLLQQCPRAFVLRYGLATISKNHPLGQNISRAFEIQTPWVLLHQTIRFTVLDYVEDYVNGTVWSKGLLKVRFCNDFVKAIEGRNRIIEELNSAGIVSISNVQPNQSEHHLVEMGVQAVFNLIQHPMLVAILKKGTIERLNPTQSVRNEKLRIYSAPDLIHRTQEGVTLIKLNVFGKKSVFERRHQASLLRLYVEGKATILQFSLIQRSWIIKKTVPTDQQVQAAMGLVRLDVNQMERMYSLVGEYNNLDKVPLADTYRACMKCQVRFICPSKDGLERAKAEQFSMMCE